MLFDLRHGSIGWLLAGALLVASGCDTVTPVDESRLVVEGFMNSGRPLSEIQIRRTLSPSRGYVAEDAAVADAVVELTLGERSIRYLPDAAARGTYRPEDSGELAPAAGQTFSFRAEWNGSTAAASGRVPPEISILNVSLNVPDEPVSAVLLDSLDLTDSLSTGLYTGYIYPIEAEVEWDAAAGSEASADDFWIRAQLKPFAAFSSPVVDLFLRSEEIFREAEQRVSSGRRTWTGVYAVGVANEDDPLPEHRLRIALVRSGADYARFAASRDAPERREPISNLSEGVGIFAAISVDSTHVDVEPAEAAVSTRIAEPCRPTCPPNHR